MKKWIFLLLLAMGQFLYSENIQLIFIDRDLDWPLEGVMVQIVGEEQVYYSDFEGKLTLELDTVSQRTVILAQYPGYDNLRYALKAGEDEIRLDMLISGVIEGEELVVERSVPGKSDETPGVSVVMDAEEMDTTANIGVVEDAMSSIKTLPGVGYAGGWNAMPSIRGGDPNELAAVLDGVYITFPYHWGGAFSIFNPNMTESVKLSHGIFSARYGKALAGILEVNSKDIYKDTRSDIIVSTSSTDLFVQTPISDKMDLFLGGKVTYLETVMFLSPDESITVPPYIRDFYGKWEYRPINPLKFYINAFVGSDGVGVDAQITSEGINMSQHFDYTYLNSFIVLGAELARGADSLYQLSFGYNSNIMDTEFEMSYGGTREYSDAFVADYGSLPGVVAGAGYSLDGLSNEGESSTHMHQLQGRLQGDHSLNENHLLSWGLEEVFNFSDSSERFYGFSDQYTGSSWELVFGEITLNSEGNKTTETAGYLTWEIGSDNTEIKGEVGVRGEHFYVWNKDFDLKTYPVFSPRYQLSWKTLEDKGALDELSLSLGSGLFAHFPMEGAMIEKEWGLEDFSVGANRSFMQVLGTDIAFLNDWSFQLEGYYKYLYNRLYIVIDNAASEQELDIHQDGTGHVGGFDLMLKKDINRYFDGYLSYSFIYSRLMNPYEPVSDSESAILPRGAPLNQWYYPDYHRFHNANLVVNWHPAPGWTFTTSASFATGNPMREVGDVFFYPANYNGTIIERYQRDSNYSDSLRYPFTIPVDFRLSYKRYKKGSKWQEEFYIAVEDAFVNLYTPQGNSSYNSFTGTETPSGADFNIGIPIPSIGYKASY